MNGKNEYDYVEDDLPLPSYDQVFLGAVTNIIAIQHFSAPNNNNTDSMPSTKTDVPIIDSSLQFQGNNSSSKSRALDSGNERAVTYENNSAMRKVDEEPIEFHYHQQLEVNPNSDTDSDATANKRLKSSNDNNFNHNTKAMTDTVSSDVIASSSAKTIQHHQQQQRSSSSSRRGAAVATPVGDETVETAVSNEPVSAGRWTSEEHQLFLQGVLLYGRDWRRMTSIIKTRSVVQIRTHAQKVFKTDFPHLNNCRSSTSSSSSSIGSNQNNNTATTSCNQIICSVGDKSNNGGEIINIKNSVDHSKNGMITISSNNGNVIETSNSHNDDTSNSNQQHQAVELSLTNRSSNSSGNDDRDDND